MLRFDSSPVLNLPNRPCVSLKLECPSSYAGMPSSPPPVYTPAVAAFIPTSDSQSSHAWSVTLKSFTTTALCVCWRSLPSTSVLGFLTSQPSSQPIHLPARCIQALTFALSAAWGSSGAGSSIPFKPLEGTLRTRSRACTSALMGRSSPQTRKTPVRKTLLDNRGVRAQLEDSHLPVTR